MSWQPAMPVPKPIKFGARYGAMPEVKIDVGLGHEGEGDAANEGEVVQDR